MDTGQGLYVKFGLEARVDRRHFKKTGEEKWRDVEYIEIHVPGDKTNVPHRPVTDDDRKRFQRQYDAWKRGLQEVHDGQPLKLWAAIRPSEVNMLAQANVHTVEQLAAVSDENAGRIGPILALRDKARKHLEQLRLAAPIERLERALEAERQEKSALLERLERLERAASVSEEAEEAGAETPKRRGRPPKQREPEPQPMETLEG